LNFRENLKEITKEVEGKTLDEVKAYSKVFWSRIEEIAGPILFFRIFYFFF